MSSGKAISFAGALRAIAALFLAIALMTPAMRKNRAEGQFYTRDIAVGNS
jgi:hypothetical protein